MKQCMRISFTANMPKNFLDIFIKKHARRLLLEGTVQMVTDDTAHIAACGKKDRLDEFLDLLHKGTTKVKPHDISIEPFLKSKDYRGVFRVIE